MLRTFARSQPLGALSAAIIASLVLMALLAEQIAPYDPLQFHYHDLLSPPSQRFLLGTDGFGRDVLSQVIWGARISLYVGIAAVLLGQLGGGLLGLLSGYWGGKVDLVSQRLTDLVMVMPSLVLALTMVALLGKSLNNVVIAIAIGQAPSAVRTARSVVLGIRENLYVEAARAIGCTRSRVLLRHVLPHCVAPLLVLAAASVGQAIMFEAALSFLGLGVPPPAPAWGRMLSTEGRAAMQQAPWIITSPAVAITVVVFAFNMLGDALRDYLDPRRVHAGDPRRK